MRLLLAALILAPSLAWGQGTEPPASVPGALNPAVTQSTLAATICRRGWAATARPPASYTEGLKRIAMAGLGISWSKRAAYVLDHRIPIEAGGAPRDPLNLWVEIKLGAFGASAKDKLEGAVRADICAHRLTLEQGRAIFLGDWAVEYQRRFPTR